MSVTLYIENGFDRVLNKHSLIHWICIPPFFGQLKVVHIFNALNSYFPHSNNTLRTKKE